MYAAVTRDKDNKADGLFQQPLRFVVKELAGIRLYHLPESLYLLVLQRLESTCRLGVLVQLLYVVAADYGRRDGLGERVA